MGKTTDMAGENINGFHVVEYIGLNKHRSALWKCKCLYCGKESIKQGTYLRSGRTSCECSRRNTLIEQSTKHGLSHTRIYKEYCFMKTRCFNKNREEYKHYGGRE